jgi:hypothetical protein
MSRNNRWAEALRIVLLVSAAVLTIAPTSVFAQMATAERVEGPGWWPTKRSPSRDDFVGPEQCGTCHPRQGGTQPTTSMARTGQRATESDILHKHDVLTFHAGSYAYAIQRGERQSVYTVTDGTQSLTAPLTWAFGAGKVGQSFLFEREGALFESRVSYYDSVQGLDFTPNRALTNARDVNEAMARPVGDTEIRRCFGCHTTASATLPDGVNFTGLIPGVTCEACHGPGKTHVAEMRLGHVKAGRGAITNPRSFSPADSVDFCGSCHATFWDVKLANERGIAALRSQPYRLQSSRCWGEGDPRLTCIACHDPHKPLVQDALSYDQRCLACHMTAGSTPTASQPGRACRVATEKCASCHMPKYDVPGMHFKFTDHFIRIAGADALQK